MNGKFIKSSAPLTYVVGIVGAFLIVFILVQAMQRYTAPEPVGTARAEERLKNLRELRQTEAEVLGEYAWHDQAKDLVRLPIEEAMEQTVQRYRDPGSVRELLIERVDKATAPPPQEPSPFE